jgi:2'-5' RNA ligase
VSAARTTIATVVGRARVPPRVTWVKDVALHVTLRFIGETPESQVPAIQRALSRLTIAPVDVTWDTLGTLGGMRYPRVVWVASSHANEPLQKIAADVNDLLEPVAGPGDLRPFKAHVTLARVRDPGRDVDWKGALAAVEWRPSVTHVKTVVLYQSRLSPEGPTYTALSTHG